MSRAFIKEDDFVDDLPDRPISEHSNNVTREGLAQIEAALIAARRQFAAAQANGEREALAHAARDVRYWSARRASAQVVASSDDAKVVQFGSSVTILRDDGRQQTFRIVGEDEANPASGTLSHSSPLAMSLMGKCEGDSIPAGRGDAQIVAIRR